MTFNHYSTYRKIPHKVLVGDFSICTYDDLYNIPTL